MIKIFYILFAVSLCNSFANGQWVQQTSGVSTGFTDVEFINQSTGWVCGDLGTIIKTTNKGVNWITQNSGVSEILYGIHPVDSDVVYCVGIFETILKSTNGGNNWIIIRGNVNPGKFFYELYFLNRFTGWICGSGQWLLRTTNGGNTFDSSSVPATFYDVYFKDNLNGLISGQTGNLFKSSNGGINWTQINVFTETAEFFQLSFIGDTGWIAGWQNRKVYKTTNFGSTWDSLTRIPETVNWSVSSLFFSSINTGWACGGSGNVYKSTDGGYNWYKQVIPVFTAYSSVFFVDDSTGWCGGNTGNIIHTIAGGQIVSLSSLQTLLLNEYTLLQNFPNPFNPITKIKYQIVNNNIDVKLTVYDIRGREIKVLVNKKHILGMYEIEFNAVGLPSGIYFYTLKTADIVITKKMLLIK